MASASTTESLPPALYTDLKDKVVLLTGIGQVGNDKARFGNGAATAYAFAQQGARIFGCDLKLEAAKATQDRIRSLIPERIVELEVVEGDATKNEQVKSVVDACINKYGRIDILINNVGMSQPGGPAEMDEKTWDAQIDVNLKSVYLFCHHVLPIMEMQGSGTVVNIASIAGMRYIGKPQIAYSATKAGVIQFTKATAVIYARKSVRMNVVVPGLIHTPLVELLAEKYNKGDYQGLVDKRNSSVPMGWQGESLDVANTILFLASSQSRYITGQKIVVDGGITSSTAPG